MKNSLYYGVAIFAVIAIIGTTLAISGSSSSNTTPTGTSITTNSHGGSPAQATPKGNQKPEFTLTSLSDGKIVDASHFNGKPTLLKLGTTYCHVCQQEIPEMKQAHQELGDSANVAFVLIGASQKEAQIYVEKYDLPYNVYTDTGSAGRTFNVLGTPTHAILGADGTLANRQVGFMSASQITSSLQSLL